LLANKVIFKGSKKFFIRIPKSNQKW
jgi:hypothetical protein